MMSGQAARRAILILSEREEVAAWAQQEPQYCGMCWFLVWVRKFTPLTLPQCQAGGGAAAGAGERTRLGRGPPHRVAHDACCDALRRAGG